MTGHSDIISILARLSRSLDTLYLEVEQTLKIVQTAAVLEVLHSMVGLVKSPWKTALMQGLNYDYLT